MRKDGPEPRRDLVEARRLTGAMPDPGEFTYSVLEPEGGDKRVRPRQRTRLRTGKLLDRSGHFLGECLIHDRSDTGCRLRVPGGLALPDGVFLFEDQAGTLVPATVVWRVAGEFGLRLMARDASGRTMALEAEMRRRFYAMRR